MRARMVTMLVSGLVVTVLDAPDVMAGPAPAVRSAPSCDGSLHRVPSPTLHGPVMGAVDGSGPGDVWVAGGALDPDVVGPLYWHWNGSGWRVEQPATPNFADADDVEVIGPDDAWAVGWQSGGNLIQHWDGVRWRSVPTGLPVSEVALESIDSVSPTNLWAVGARQPNSGRGFVPRSFVVHTTGAGWHTVPQPQGVARGTVLLGVAVASKTNVWAVGGTGLRRQLWYDSPRTIVEHWNGAHWTVVPSPSPSSKVNVLQSVAVVGPHDVWAVGLQSGDVHSQRPLVLHFDGTSWHVLDVPWRAGDSGDLFDVSASPSMGVWAFGRRSASGSDNTHPLVERLGRNGWRRVDQPPRWGSLYGGWAGDGEVWTVGETKNRAVTPLVERVC